MWTPIFSASIESLAYVARKLPFGRARLRAVRLNANLCYKPGSQSPAHRFDVWLPRGAQGPLPLVMYIHGGGFCLGSKDSHWWMGAHLAAQGFCVAMVNYRLAPKHPHPAALADVAAAFDHIARHARALGGDPERMALMGESAGANLALALVLAQRAHEPPAWLGTAPPARARALVPAAGLLDVAQPERFLQTAPKVGRVVFSRIQNVCRSVLPSGASGLEPEMAWASPLRVLEDAAQEAGRPLGSPLPPILVGTGACDPILDDSTRLADALHSLGAQHALKLYPGAGHAFFAWPRHAMAESFWQDTVTFLRAQLGSIASASQRQVAPSATQRRSQ